MAVTEQTPINAYTGNGSSTVFAYNWRLLNAADMVVQINGVTQTLGVHYTVSGVGNDAGGNVTFTTAPGSGLPVVLYRDTDLARSTDYQNNGDLLAETVNADFDRLWLALQDIYGGGKATPSAVRVPNGETVPALPNAATRANRVLAFDGSGNPLLIVGVDPSSASAFAADLANSTNPALGSALVGHRPAGVGTVGRTVQSRLRDVVHAADYGVVSDGVTMQTAAINAATAALGAAGFRGTLVIPQNTRFDPVSVFAACPTGVGLDITDTVNWGQPPGYKNKFRILYYGDLVDDDTQQIIASGHHPAFMTLNMGTAPSVAATNRYATWLHGVGRDVDGDPMLGWLQQFAKHPSLDRWRISWRLQTPYNVAIANPTNWTSGQVVAAGAYRRSDGGKVYQTVAGGTCGATAPTGTGSSINDGGVLWNYVQAALNIDSTRFDVDENANAGFYGPTSVRMTFVGGTREHFFEVDPATNDVVWRDASRSADLWRSSTSGGIRTGRIQSFNRVNTTISATGALVLQASMHALTASGGPWDITDLTLPAGQTSGMVTLWFLTTNLVLKNNANIVTRTGADIASAANMMITLYKDTAVSGSWIVMNRN